MFDVAIAGGGPAGSSLALRLARRGVRVVLFDTTRIKRKICGEYICPRGADLLKGLGVECESRPVRGMKLFSPAGLDVDSRFPGKAEGLAVRRDVLDPTLLRLALKAGAQIFPSTRLDSFVFVFDGEGWVLNDGIRARLLVGADGRQSAVARKLGVSLPANRKRVALHLFASATHDTPDYGEMHVLRDGSYVGISPTGKRELNLSLVCDAEKVGNMVRDAAERILSLSPELKVRFLPLDSMVHVCYPISQSVSAVAGDAWALVGDAAGFLDPLTGEGMYQALLSSTLLDACLATEFGRDPVALKNALARYAQEHRRTFAGKSRVNRLFQTLIQYPAACEWVGRALQKNPYRAEAFIGMVSNVYRPAEGMRRLVFGD